METKGNSGSIGHKDIITSLDVKDKHYANNGSGSKMILLKKIGKRNSLGYNNKFNLSSILRCKIE